MSRSEQVREDLHARTIAEHYGFRSLRAFEEQPQNAELIAQRGNLDALSPGDALAVPDGFTGVREVGTGRVHEVRLATGVTVLEVRLYSDFRVSNPMGDKEKSSLGWRAFGGRGVWQIEATVTVWPAGKPGAGRPPQATNARNGKLEVAGLADGAWEMLIEPCANETSSGAAGLEDPRADHGLVAPFKPNNGTYQVEYRPVLLAINVAKGNIAGASVETPSPPDRPHHAVLFWLNVGESGTRQVLEVDWKPDFVRRSRPGNGGTVVRPVQVERDPTWEKIEDREKLIIVHHTTGESIGGALNTFTPSGSTSGAQYVLDFDGHVVRMADDRYWTKHGGGGKDSRPPSWDNVTQPTINDRAVGIEVVHKGKVDQLFGTLGKTKEPRPFQDAQYLSLIGLIRALQESYGVTPRRVIGHQDATLKAECPSPFFEWERLEEAGVALRPEALTETELDQMFGGFFAGEDGRTRRLYLHATERKEGADHVVTQPKQRPEVVGLNGAPIEELRDALVQVGYGAAVPSSGRGIFLVVDGAKEWPKKHVFDRVLGFCLSQFVRHYCTGSRLREDAPMPLAYRDSPRVSSKLFLDFDLAVLVAGAAKAARVLRASEPAE